MNGALCNAKVLLIKDDRDVFEDAIGELADAELLDRHTLEFDVAFYLL